MSDVNIGDRALLSVIRLPAVTSRMTFQSDNVNNARTIASDSARIRSSRALTSIIRQQAN
jgi:hypothetical protein